MYLIQREHNALRPQGGRVRIHIARKLVVANALGGRTHAQSCIDTRSDLLNVQWIY